MSTSSETADDFRAEIGRAFRDARAMRKLSQVEVAKRARTKQSTVSEVERGVENVKLDTLLRIAIALGLTMRVRFTPDEQRDALGGAA